MMTLQLTERCGINTIISNIALSEIINKYWYETGGKIQSISDSRQNEENIVKSVEAGASAIYFHGEIADKYVQEGKYDEIVKSLEFIRSYGIHLKMAPILFVWECMTSKLLKILILLLTCFNLIL